VRHDSKPAGGGGQGSEELGPVASSVMVQRLPFLASILNRANRVPSMGNFDSDRQRNLQRIVEASRLLLVGKSTFRDLYAARLPKYRSLLGVLSAVPSWGQGSFDDDWTANMEALLGMIHDKVGVEEGGNQVPRVVFANPSPVWSPQTDDIRKRLCAALEAENMEVGPYWGDDPLWFHSCLNAQVCMPLLSADFLHSVTCEAKLTFAKDSMKQIIPIVVDDKGYWSCMNS